VDSNGKAVISKELVDSINTLTCSRTRAYRANIEIPLSVTLTRDRSRALVTGDVTARVRTAGSRLSAAMGRQLTVGDVRGARVYNTVGDPVLKLFDTSCRGLLSN
jgi:hypothetical protein